MTKAEPHRSLVLEAALVAAVVTITIVATVVQGQAGARALDPLGYFLLGAGSLCVAGVRRAPRVTLATTTTFFVIYLRLGYPQGSEWLPHFLALTGVTAAGYRWLAIGVAGALMSSGLIWRLVDGSGFSGDGESFIALVGIATALLAGEWLRVRRDYVAATEQRAVLAEQTRDEEARRRVADERLRIARELHDVLAHSLASINVQAGTTLHVLRKHPQQAEETLGSIKRASGEALDELRATLGALREGEEIPSRLADLDRLLEPARRSGLDVRVRTWGRVREVPTAVDLAAYRILQESLTNAIRYAAPATISIVLEYAPDELRVLVEDDGPGRALDTTGNGTGSGIDGMRARAADLGGTFEAGPQPTGGFSVRAALPINGAPS